MGSGLNHDNSVPRDNEEQMHDNGLEPGGGGGGGAVRLKVRNNNDWFEFFLYLICHADHD